MEQKKRMSGQERKEQIIDAAIKVFSENGFKGTKTREIAEACEVSEATIFKHFRNKEDLYRSIIKKIRKVHSHELNVFLTRPKSAWDVLKITVLEILREFEEDPSFLRLILYSALEDKKFAFNFIEENMFGKMEIFKKIIKMGIKKGELRNVDPDLAAQMFSDMIGGYCVSQYILKQTKPLDNKDIAETYVDIFLNGIRK